MNSPKVGKQHYDHRRTKRTGIALIDRQKTGGTKLRKLPSTVASSNHRKHRRSCESYAAQCTVTLCTVYTLFLQWDGCITLNVMTSDRPVGLSGCILLRLSFVVFVYGKRMLKVGLGP